MKQNGTITIQFVFRLRNQGDPSLHFHLTAWSRSLSLCRQWQKNSPRSLSVPKCGFITSNDFSTRQSLHWPEVGLNGLALVTRAQLMVKSASSTIPLSLRLQMYLERQVRPRWLGFYIYIYVCALMIEQWQIYLTYHQWMGILPLKKRVYKSIYKSRQMEFRDKTE